MHMDADMGFRFQKRIKLFPGVRLNFSAGGISTTVGVRGASVTLGKRGAYLNVGIPGTGLSYRERIGGPGAHHSGKQSAGVSTPERPLLLPQQSTSQPFEPTDVPGAIRSAPVNAMTSAGLDQLKTLINEAALKRIELVSKVCGDETAIVREQKRLRRARWFIVRLFTSGKIRKLTQRIAELQHSLAIRDYTRQAIHVLMAFRPHRGIWSKTKVSTSWVLTRFIWQRSGPSQ